MFHNLQQLTASQISQIIEDRRLPISSNQNLGQPPTYNEAIRTPNIERKNEKKIISLERIVLINLSFSVATSGPPPSYDSLYGRVMEAQKQSKGFLDFLKNIFVLLLGTRKLNLVVRFQKCFDFFFRLQLDVQSFYA